MSSSSSVLIAAALLLAMQQSAVGQRAPFAAAKRDEMCSTDVSPLALCTPLGSPKQAYGPGTFRVVQTPGFVFMLADFAHSYRIIPTDGRPHVGAAIHLFDGDSRGRWDG